MAKMSLSNIASSESSKHDTRHLSSNHILLVEDDLIIGADAKAQLLDAGVTRVTVATTIARALNALNSIRFDFAFLDIHLGKENAFPLAEVLVLYKVPFAFVTGASSGALIPQEFSENIIISKPYATSALIEALDKGLSTARQAV